MYVCMYVYIYIYIYIYILCILYNANNDCLSREKKRPSAQFWNSVPLAVAMRVKGLGSESRV